MPIAIKAENISKAYQLGEIGTGTLSRDLERWVSQIRGKEDPFLKIGETNDRTIKGTSDIVWSLKDINFEIEQGDAVGIIGRNGAGKSTLLKILSRVTSPTTGRIIGKGRVASLLEVGTGFNPELTGGENIYLNGAILGMKRREIKQKFDEIVAFAGIERYIDTPVKRYSSGMYVRLAFAVAANLDAEILIVDEVLAVGDAEFQKKCLGKMGEVSKGEGRTILFVSHNLSSVNTLCNNGILMNNGLIQTKGSVEFIIDAYNKNRNNGTDILLPDPNKINRKAWLVEIEIRVDNLINSIIKTYSACEIIFKINAKEIVENVQVGLAINDSNEARLLTLFSKSNLKKYSLKQGVNEVVCKINCLPLKPGFYAMEVFIGNEFETFDYYDKGLSFEVKHSDVNTNWMPDSSQGSFYVEQNWL